MEENLQSVSNPHLGINSVLGWMRQVLRNQQRKNREENRKREREENRERERRKQKEREKKTERKRERIGS